MPNNEPAPNPNPGKENIFSQFTGKYALSKTLRFELKPVGNTLDNMRKNLRYDKELQTFLADQEIEDAYQTLKPVLDFLHEHFITESLESETAKSINFSEYLKIYRNRRDLKDKDFEVVEKSLRASFLKTYDDTAKNFKNKAGKDSKNKDILSESGYSVLTEKGILRYIRKNSAQFSELKSKQEIENALDCFEGFYTYLGGFNQNRENYYETTKEAATAIASRVVHENLPKFCDNILFFEERKEEYESIYTVLKELGKSLINKEGVDLFIIDKNLFKIEHFNDCLSQKGIEKYNDQIGNANFLINLYNQSKKDEKRFTKLTFFKALYKQIGCGKKESFFFTLIYDKKNQIKEKSEQVTSVEEVLELAAKAGEKYFKGNSGDGIINTIPEFLEYLTNHPDYYGVYWSKQAMNTISNKYFANWHDLKDKLKEAKIFKKASAESGEDVATPLVIELGELFKVLDSIIDWKDIVFKASILENKAKKEIINSSNRPSQALLKLIFADTQEHIQAFLDNSKTILKIEDYKKDSISVKLWLDHALSINQIIKYFQVKKDKIKGKPLDSTISQALDIFLPSKDASSKDAEWFKWYDAIRNYLTKKRQDGVKKNKLKLNFENPSLLKGWDLDLENQRKTIILRENNLFYLVVFEKDSSNIFEDYSLLKPKNGEFSIEKMYFKQQTNVFRQLPRFGFPYKDNKNKSLVSADVNNFDEIKFNERVQRYGLTRELLKIKDEFDVFQASKIKGDIFNKEKLKKLIQYYKKIIEVDYKLIFSVDPILEKKYEELNDLCQDFEKVAYQLNFRPISKKYIDDLVESGKIYMFKILNKDFSSNSSRKKNLHTIYFKSLFEDMEKNTQLGANAQIFYRKVAIAEKKKKHGYEHKGHIFELNRFTEEKFLFHCPVLINARCIDGISNGKPNPKAAKIVNELVNIEISNNENVNFLGIDRGEKHLAYYSLVDKNGEIKEQGTLNIPFLDKEGKPRSIKVKKKVIDKKENETEEEVECWDYNDLLEARAGNRDYARKNWQTIGTIKELKDGYVSQVVRKIADLALKYNAFIVLEDLNTGFKRGRQKIDKSVYQKLELALAKKLNFLVDKKAKTGEIGSVSKALQLTPPVSNYGDMENKKQLGIMLYTRANYTSQTDPVTGWRKSIYLKKGSEGNIKKQISEEFKDIVFDKKDYCFTYIDKKTKKEWSLYSGKNGKSLDRFHGERDNDKNQWIRTPQELVVMLDELFANCEKNRSIYEQVIDGDVELVKIKGSKHSAWESLRFVIEMIQQIRNTGTEEKDNDFILSPVRNENREHFDSRKATKEQPNSGDANGAFNIAVKGIIMNEHTKLGRSLFIADQEWDAWLIGKEYWEKWIKDNPETKKEILKWNRKYKSPK